ncbi:hypothetical protein K791_13942 [Salmonella enterica subsp. enterica serovar Newport str. SHSN001]|nr:hypothetical protein K791_13942 [Salmonella enterica subsp. enterica serovar Newport str. SHSN001]
MVSPVFWTAFKALFTASVKPTLNIVLCPVDITPSVDIHLKGTTSNIINQVVSITIDYSCNNVRRSVAIAVRSPYLGAFNTP